MEDDADYRPELTDKDLFRVVDEWIEELDAAELECMQSIQASTAISPKDTAIAKEESTHRNKVNKLCKARYAASEFSMEDQTM
jgi:hypothetical protein